MSQTKYVIDGSFLLQTPLGVQRYAKEITLEMDKYSDLNMIILVPEGAIKKYDLNGMYNNIKIKEYGKKEGRKWLQLDFPRYLRKNKAQAICLCNEVPIFGKISLACVHDIVFKTHPEYFTQPGDWHEILFRKMMYKKAFSRARHIVTVSEFSKGEILSNYKLKNKNVIVAGNAWQHFDVNDIDESVFEEYPQIKKGEYYYYLASLAPNKNLKWIVENAKKHPNKMYVLSGKKLDDKSGIESLANACCTGFVSDGRAKALMKYCKAFVFPSTYEGFGIPPMEALCMGADIVLGDIEVLREIYEPSAYFIDCYDADCDIDDLIKKEGKKLASLVLNRYSWSDSADKIIKALL